MTLTLLVLQTLLAIVALRQLARRVFPYVAELEHPRLVTAVWGPLTIALPLALTAARIDGTVAGIGWIPFGAPVACGWAAFAAAVIVTPGVASRHAPGTLALAAAVATGLMLLLLGAAHRMSIWVGQCGFAVAAVLLWVNTPAVDHDRSAEAMPAGVGAGMLVALLAGIGQGVIAWRIDASALPISAGLLVAFAVTATCLAGAGGVKALLAIGLWSSVYGVLLGLGVLAFAAVVPAAANIVLDGRGSGRVGSTIADGFGAYAGEAVALIVLAGAPLAMTVLPSRLQRPLGVLLLLGIAIVGGLRVAGCN